MKIAWVSAFVGLMFSGMAVAAEGMADAVKLVEAGDLAGAKLILEAQAAKNPGNAAIQNYLRNVTLKLDAQAKVRRQLDAVVVPQFSLRDVSAREAFDYAVQQIKKNAPPTMNVNLVWMVPSEYPSRVTLQLQDIPASQALIYLAEVAGLRVSFEEHAIRVALPRSAVKPVSE